MKSKAVYDEVYEVLNKDTFYKVKRGDFYFRQNK